MSTQCFGAEYTRRVQRTAAGGASAKRSVSLVTTRRSAQRLLFLFFARRRRRRRRRSRPHPEPRPAAAAVRERSHEVHAAAEEARAGAGQGARAEQRTQRIRRTAEARAHVSRSPEPRALAAANTTSNEASAARVMRSCLQPPKPVSAMAATQASATARLRSRYSTQLAKKERPRMASATAKNAKPLRCSSANRRSAAAWLLKGCTARPCAPW